MVATGQGAGTWRVTANGYEVSLHGGKNALELNRGDGYMTL